MTDKVTINRASLESCCFSSLALENIILGVGNDQVSFFYTKSNLLGKLEQTDIIAAAFPRDVGMFLAIGPPLSDPGDCSEPARRYVK